MTGPAVGSQTMDGAVGGLALPPLVVVADSAETGGRPLAQVIGQAVGAGARAVWLRDRQAQPEDRQQLAAELAATLHERGGWLIASPGPGSEHADGVHLAGADGWPASTHGLVGRSGHGLVGRSCHGLAELARAASEGCHWATLSPIFVSASKPGYGPALGPAVLARAPLPTWALGGVDAANAGACLGAGAAGVFVMGAVLRATDPAAAVAALLAAIERAGDLAGQEADRDLPGPKGDR